ncbi:MULTISPECIES: glycosyltransferase family 4 protein [Catenuloplanes]|uniref:Glycosyltransferase involved in cell wall biosynthesis n=1 Tax=Catenuloplanes niger TaxID=587534 RepID=A0AAE3ZUL4_9ACTN|nr:glycosyltransferase family 4 protein [Catenuloplanes niger]MDR7326374.1 glycosyltransferase involved in cell wall biosynthesis [Catenuloplanes niger]
MSESFATAGGSADPPPSLRILAVTNLWPSPGGFRGVFVRDQVESLRAAGHHVDVEVVAQQRGKSDYLTAAPRVRARAAAGGYDLVHVHYGLTALASRLIKGTPRVLSLYGSDVNEPWQRRITRATTGTVAATIYPSRRLAAAAGDPDGFVVPNAVDFDLFTPPATDDDRERIRASFGIAPGDQVVLFGGLPENQVKGYDVFRAVLDKLSATGAPIRELVLAEAGQERDAVVRKFAASDALLLTSRRGTESGPLVVKEAAVMGVPVVTVDVGDTPEILDGVSPSAIVPFPDPWGTAAATDELVANLAAALAPILEARTRADGRERLRRLAPDAVTATLVDVYRRVLATAGGTR